ncbi:hypothetical protein GCM10027082_06420 [Comamonas humi]
MFLSEGSQHGRLLEYLRQQNLPEPAGIIKINTFGVCWNLMTRSDSLLACPSGILKVEPYKHQVSRIPLRHPLSLAANTLAELFRQEISALEGR